MSTPNGRSNACAHRLIAGAATAALMMGAGAAHAQTAAVSEVQELTVTAQKREERLQDVPISVAVVGGDTLQRLKLNESSDLQYLVPGLTLNSSSGPRSYGFFIRGIGTTTFSTETIESSTAYIVDGVVYGQAGATAMDLPDIERIEVLRGPQGTLFGKNASAGAINIVTKRPSDTLTGQASLSWAWPDDERKFTAYLSGPITDTLKFSLSGRMNKRDGIVDNVFDGRKLNDRNDWGVRGKLLWEPSDKLDVTVIADYYRRDANCCIWTLRRFAPTRSPGENESAAAGIVPGPKNLQQNVNGGVFTDLSNVGLSVEANYELGDHVLTSITSYRFWETQDGLDTDNSPANRYDINFATFKQAQWTQELRLTSPTGQFFEYVAGLYFFNSNVNSASFQYQPLVATAFGSVENYKYADNRNIAVFGQGNINFTDNLRGIVGARYLKERLEFDRVRRDARSGVQQPFSGTRKENGFVWRLGLQYDVTDDIMTFATVTRGYKAGGFDGLAVTVVEVEPEIPTNYEVGVRTSWPSIRATLNATLFHTTVKDYQVSARDPELNAYFLTNAAKVRSQGIEVDATWKPFAEHDLTLMGSAAAIDGEWQKFNNAACYAGQTAAQGCTGTPATQDISGGALPRLPHWTVSANAHYERELPGSGLTGSVDVGLSHRSKANVAYPSAPFTFQDNVTLVNANVGIGESEGRWRLSLYARNLFDEHYVLNILGTPTGGVGSTSQTPLYEAQRVVGVGLDVKF
jgi:iron complex outermembrane receptor protein